MLHHFETLTIKGAAVTARERIELECLQLIFFPSNNNLGPFETLFNSP